MFYAVFVRCVIVHSSCGFNENSFECSTYSSYFFSPYRSYWTTKHFHVVSLFEFSKKKCFIVVDSSSSIESHFTAVSRSPNVILSHFVKFRSFSVFVKCEESTYTVKIGNNLTFSRVQAYWPFKDHFDSVKLFCHVKSVDIHKYRPTIP